MHDISRIILLACIIGIYGNGEGRFAVDENKMQRAIKDGQFQGDSASNTTEDATTGNKSQSNSARRTPVKSFGSSLPNKRLSTNLMKRYIQIKKELANKHVIILFSLNS